MKIYGIKNCDTVKKALNWLDERQVNYEFHDFKKLGISVEKLEAWAAKTGWEALLNKRGTTWKKLDPETQNSIVSKEAAFALMQEKTSVIKRPVMENEENVLVGFDDTRYSQLVLGKE